MTEKVAAKFLERLDGRATTQLDRRCVAITEPDCAAAEQYRVLYHRLARTRAERALPAIALTSALHGEGKSVTAANLALTAARAAPERRIALVDCDLRRPMAHRLLGLAPRSGLADVLAGRAEVGVALTRVAEGPLTVVTAGELNGADSAALLSSSRMRTLLDYLRGLFDEIYLDAPPALGNADGPIACARADATLLVVRSGATPRESVADAVAALGGSAVLGLVLNGVDERLVPRRLAS